ncbi:MAG: hypothetical protein ACREVE_18045 [Gammaproteobacteria bacterium]
MLILVVPVQGVAAVSAGICMALGHHGRLPRMSMVRRAGTSTIMTPPAVTAIMMMTSGKRPRTEAIARLGARDIAPAWVSRSSLIVGAMQARAHAGTKKCGIEAAHPPRDSERNDADAQRDLGGIGIDLRA